MMLTIEIILLLMGVAFVAGVIDAVAGGGGLLTIPALMAAGVPPVAAIATNKLQGTFGTGGAFLAFARAGHIDFRRFARPAAAAFIGSAGGAYVLQQIDSTFLAGFIPLLLVAMAIYYLTAPKISDVDTHGRLGAAGLLLVIAAIGFYDGFFGPGTGSFLITALVTLAGLGMVRAIAHTKLLNFASNLSALAIMISGGHVMWVLGLSMALASVAGGQAGAHMTMKFGGRAVRPLLVVMSLALTVKLLANPENPLTAAVLAWWRG
jgi:uncharacterized membrane protein YfcA